MHPFIAEYGATSARRRTLGLIAVNFSVFAALLVVMFHVRATSSDWPIAPPFEFGNLLMVFAMAMSGVCASITMVVAGHCAARSKTEEAERWIAIAISSWL